MLDTGIDVLDRVLADVLGAFAHNWPYLIISVVAAAALSVHVGTERMAGWMRRRRWTAITGAVLLATLTPFCSCGTTATVLGMLATRTPWAPIVAFMVASPLTSPSELPLSAGLFGWPFAVTYFLAATALGFAAGGIAGLVEDRGLLAGQARMRPASTGCGCGEDGSGERGGQAAACGERREGPGATPASPVAVRTRLAARLRLREVARETWVVGRRMVGYFVAYTSIAYLVLELLPDGALTSVLGGNPIWGVPLAALVGIPVYITSEGSLPMVAALTHGGLGAGTAMAFLLTGAGTSVPAITGVLVIARRRVVGLVVAILFVGATVTGWVATAILG